MIPADLKYLESHEWCRVQGDEAVFGITDHAQHELGDIVYVELPAVGTAVTKGTPFGSVESVKTASDLNAPVSGEVIEVNEALNGSPELVNSDPYGAGWIVKVRFSDHAELGDLFDAAGYEKIASEH
jgi:glycine cleavage system H protein